MFGFNCNLLGMANFVFITTGKSSWGHLYFFMLIAIDVIVGPILCFIIYKEGDDFKV